MGWIRGRKVGGHWELILAVLVTSNENVFSESSHREGEIDCTRICLLALENKMSSHVPNTDGTFGKEFGLDISELISGSATWLC